MPKKKHTHQVSSFLPPQSSVVTPTSYQLLSWQSPNCHDPIPSSTISQPSKYSDFYSYFVMNLKITQLCHLWLASFAYFLFVFFTHFSHLISIDDLDILVVCDWEVIGYLRMFFIRSRMLEIGGVCLRCLLMGVGGGLLDGIVIGVGFGIRANEIVVVVMFYSFLMLQTNCRQHSDFLSFLPAWRDYYPIWSN